MDLRFAKWEVSVSYTQGFLRKIDTMHIQNGKQGENKSLASENASAMAQSAGQESK
jgi:hypothetical protein